MPRLTPRQRRAALRRDRHNRAMRPLLEPEATPAERQAIARETMAEHDAEPPHRRLYAIENFWPD